MKKTQQILATIISLIILTFFALPALAQDSDGDGVNDDVDNCPFICNSEQRNADLHLDGLGDVCDDTPGCGGCGEPVCEEPCRFIDNGDGTVTDLLTNLIWLKDATCFGGTWSHTTALTAGLNSGECGLSDGSAEGDWRLPTKAELQSIGTEPPATWYDGVPSVTWTVPDAPFTDVETWYYWTSNALEGNIYGRWSVALFNGYTIGSYIEDSFYAWSVRNALLAQCAPGCPDSWVGDGFCDSDCYVASCSYDGVDCEGQCALGCPDNWIGDGECDPDCLVASCSYDGGDC